MTTSSTPPKSNISLDDFFLGYERSRQLFDALRDVIEPISQYELRVSKSHIAFHCHKAFAWIWIPAKYLRGETAPLVLSLSLPARDTSPRWKEIVEPYPGRFMLHLELFSEGDINE